MGCLELNPTLHGTYPVLDWVPGNNFIFGYLI